MLATVLAGEYRRRVQTKAFILTTLLAPIGMVAVMAAAIAAIYFSVESESAKERRIAIYDEGGRILPALERQQSETFQLLRAPSALDDAKQAVRDGEADVLLVFPPGLADAGGPTDVSAFVKDKQSLTAEEALRRFVVDVVRDLRLAEFDLSTRVLDTLNEPLSLTTIAMEEDGGEAVGSTAGSAAVGLAVAIVLLMVMGIYGALVMQTTMEEKSSRMAEILVSSVRPFDLMMGKILAIGGVAVTQIAVWGAMMLAFGAVATAFLPTEELTELGVATATEGGAARIVMPDIRFDVVLVVLLMLPLGYLINGSLFGALGAMYETPQEAQVAASVAMAPMIIAMIMVQTVALAPHSAFVVFGSFFPFTAPIMLPTRMLVSDVAAWQVLLSIALCAASALAIVWVTGRIFRGSLLIYGKKLGLKDLRQILAAD